MAEFNQNGHNTYEQHTALKKVHRSTKEQPDKIYYDPEFAFRDEPYRALGHQKGVMGYITLRLLEGKALKRPKDDWSLMALGPMKHLPLSNKHGEVRSSFCSFRLMREEGEDKHINESVELNDEEICYGEEYRSSIITNSNNPVWTDNRSGSHFVIPLKKGSLPDGSAVRILAQTFEPHTAVEAVLPSQVKGGGRPIGEAKIDVTGLCMGKDTVQDLWIDLHPPKMCNIRGDVNQEKENIEISGQLRILLSYEPFGYEPQIDDIVSFESYARIPSSLIVSPLSPMRVMNREGGFLLLQYRMKTGRFGSIRVHRNSVFVIERFSVIDGAVDFALKPTDMFFASEFGQQVAHHSSPIVSAVGDFVKPVVMTGQLAKTVGVGSVSTMAKLVLAGLGQNHQTSGKHDN